MATVAGASGPPSDSGIGNPAISEGDIYNGNQQQGITGGKQNVNFLVNITQKDANNSTESKGFALLYDKVAGNARHNSKEVSDQPKCHEGTRIAVIESLMTWASHLSPSHLFYWLHGPAGAGKSTILRTIARQLFHENITKNLLLASFFFFRNAARRGSCEFVIPTIAYQLTLHIPQTREHIARAVERDPDVFSLSLMAQASALLISPLASACQDLTFNRQKYPRVIIIDGLDECSNPKMQVQLLDVLRHVALNVPISLAILVASRPEHHIRDTFCSESWESCSFSLMLDNSLNPDADIRTFLEARFETIRQKRSREFRRGVVWPTSENINVLVKKASGQFIYAATVEKFVSSPSHDPIKRLNIILGAVKAGSQKPFEALDILYSTIFRTVDEGVLPLARRILGFLLVPDLQWPANFAGFEGRSPLALEDFLDLDKGDVRRALHDLESLLTVPPRNRKSIKNFHASLADYLFDKERSKEFWIDEHLVYSDIAENFIRHLLDNNILREYFALNHEILVKKAAPTPGLHRAIVTADINRIIPPTSSRENHLLGMTRVVPTILQIATQVSAKSSASSSNQTDPRVWKITSNFNKILSPRVAGYLRNTRLMSFLVTATLAYGIPGMPHEAVRAFPMKGAPLTPEDKQVDRDKGFWLLAGEALPSVLEPVKCLLNDPSGDYFITKHQYADVALHLLRSLYSDNELLSSEREGLPYFQTLDDIWPLLLSKSQVRPDIIKETKRILQSWKSWNRRSGLQEAIREYTSKADNDGITWAEKHLTKPIRRGLKTIKRSNPRGPLVKELN